VPLFPGTLNRIPDPLLSLLELKQRGANPDTLSDTVVPTIDVTRMYNAARPSCFAGTLDLLSDTRYASPLAFNVTQVVVPDNELWWLRTFTVEVIGVDLPDEVTDYYVAQLAPLIIIDQLAVGNDGVPLNPPVQPTIIGESVSLPGDGTFIPVVGNSFFAPSLRDMWVPPRSIFGAQFVGHITVTGGSPGIRGLITVDRFKI